jgi:hypothetical protein
MAGKRLGDAEFGAGLAAELVEEGVFAVVGGPDGDVAVPVNATLGDFPELTGVGVFGEFVEAAVDGHGLGVGGEGNNSGAGVEFYDTDFDFLSEGGGASVLVETRDFAVFFAVGEDGAGEVKKLGEAVNLIHVFEGPGEVFGSEEVVAFFEEEAFAHVFEAVAEGPANADRFFGEGIDLLALGVEGIFGEDPVDLVGGELLREVSLGINGKSWENRGHSYLGWTHFIRACV